eukprot:CAMPEP_0117681868 /NCGR_PEP_ID=MMETSP0804-20121206/19262_1 /TAXON_ID=1074897 /ORGANISM="Tetraselmis astigmatica, Strain CCMP880" /LENGTH=58 /DNA_ID=CAMNT_0005491755 /DNA_START=793 /DNA_END=972 /DNA_ORIENTATION=+
MYCSNGSPSTTTVLETSDTNSSMLPLQTMRLAFTTYFGQACGPVSSFAVEQVCTMNVK